MLPEGYHKQTYSEVELHGCLRLHRWRTPHPTSNWTLFSACDHASESRANLLCCFLYSFNRNLNRRKQSCSYSVTRQPKVPFTPNKLAQKNLSNVHFISSEQVRVPRSELCTVCRRRAYPMDALIVDKKKYHKSCFCCEHCRNKLR